MERVAEVGVAVNESLPSQVGCPSTQAVSALVSGVTEATLWTVTGPAVLRIVAVMVKVTLPPGATVIATGEGTPGDPVPDACPQVDPVLAAHIQVAAGTSSSTGRGSVKLPTPGTLLGLLTMTR
jgi:hypothetical protein